MGKYVIQSHQRLQEWVAEEHGYFAAEGLDYEFQAKGLAQDSKQTSTVRSADALPAQVRAGAFEEVSTILARSELGTCSKWEGVMDALARPFESERMSVM